MIEEKSVLFAPGEAGHGGGGVAGGFASEMIAGIMTKMEEGFVVCVAANPERL